MHLLKYHIRNGKWKRQNLKKNVKNFATKFSGSLGVVFDFVKKWFMCKTGDGNSCVEKNCDVANTFIISCNSSKEEVVKAVSAFFPNTPVTHQNMADNRNNNDDDDDDRYVWRDE